MRRLQSFRLPGVVLGISLFWIFPFHRAASVPSPARTAASLFDSSTLHDLRLLINTRDLAKLRATYRENTYYPADLLWQGIRVRNVAVRSRGNDTRDPVKLGLHIDIDRYTPRQTFLGLQGLVLDNLRQDPAMMREPLAMAFFAKMGQPAPRESLGRVFINNEYLGLYAIVEDVDRPFLLRTLGRDDGFLFEYRWYWPFYGEDLGDNLSPYQLFFEARTHESESVDTLYDPIRDMFRVVNQAEGSTRAELEEYMDLDQFVTSLAIETMLGDPDALAGIHGMNNFYLYRDSGSVRHKFLPWDRDRAMWFGFMFTPIFDRLSDNALARRALSYDDLYDLYLQVLENAAQSIYDPADRGWLSLEVDRLWTLISPAVYADSNKPFSNAEFEEAVEYLRVFVALRPDFVLGQVAAARGGRLVPGR